MTGRNPELQTHFYLQLMNHPKGLCEYLTYNAREEDMKQIEKSETIPHPRINLKLNSPKYREQ